MSERADTGRGRRDPEVERRWRVHVTAWRDRGVPARAYCDEHGLSVHSLYAWGRKLAARDGDQSSDAMTPRFVAVDVRPEPASANEPCIEITPDGTIRVPVDLDAERLAAIVRVARQSVAC